MEKAVIVIYSTISRNTILRETTDNFLEQYSINSKEVGVK